jgi:carbon-monoxide dehydrogenase medium subunit
VADPAATTAPPPSLERPRSLEEAVTLLRDLGEEGEALAGGTWIMRAPNRGERLRRTYVSLAGIEELRRVERGDPTVIGAMVTHADLERLDTDAAALGAVAEAARRSAFPAVRNVATIGGNICARGFAEADLVPALLACEATVSTVSPRGEHQASLASLLESTERPPGDVVTEVRIPAPENRRGWFKRFTVRGGGEYAVASLAVSIDLDRERPYGAGAAPTLGALSADAASGGSGGVRVAFGSVEATARRWPEAERLLMDRGLAALEGLDYPGDLTDGIHARDGLDAPGWYRREILPVLLRRALDDIAAGRPG